MNMNWKRKIIHIDMDAFFASVEQRDHPEYQGKPVVVGGDPFGRGVVSTASYEARRFGIRSAMPAAEARRLCPDAVFLRPNFEMYQLVSSQIFSILRQHTELVEPISLDEAYLDVSHHRFGVDDPVMIAALIKQNIRAVTKLTASAGIAPNLFLAKIASGHQKPDGLTVILPERVEDFLKDLPVRKIPGVGPKTEARLHAMGVHTCGELALQDVSLLYDNFGKIGMWLSEAARGIDEREVEPQCESKQLSAEETFEKNLMSVEWLRVKLRDFAKEVFSDLKESGRMGKTIVLKVKYFDFQTITRSYTLDNFPLSWEEVFRIACELLEKKTEAGIKPIRLLGLGISGLQEAAGESLPAQAELFA